MSNQLAYKILAVNKDETLVSPISFTGLAVKYKMSRWSKPKNSTRYLFVYRTLKDARKVFDLFTRIQQKKLITVKCLAANFERAIGAGLVAEYRCTRLKPTKVVE